ncbi:MAG: RHS repeat-associated core domain-containing protein [Desulfobacteraceae bacterium]|nr:RHS repeat-associated core domain-containing protein [Desulfobacteraceae bacterium]
MAILPGQYYDGETGLHYNWHRYYDPETGKYLTPDPIGLAGGINPFVYVLNDPVNYVDPYGLLTISGSGGGGFTLGAGWGDFSLGAGLNVTLGFNLDLETGDFSTTLQAQLIGYDKFYGAFAGAGFQAGGGVSSCPPEKGPSDSKKEIVSGGIGLVGIPGVPPLSGEASVVFDDNGSISGGAGRGGVGGGAYYGSGTAANFNYTWCQPGSDNGIIALS